MPQNSILFFFNIHMKLLGEVLWMSELCYDQYIDDTQLYLLTPSQPSEAAKVSFRCLEDVEI